MLEIASLGLFNVPSDSNLDLKEPIWLGPVLGPQSRNRVGSKFCKPKKATWPNLVSGLESRNRVCLKIEDLDGSGLF